METQTLGLQIGSVCCALKLKDEGVYNRLKRLYRDYFTDQSADIVVELERCGRQNQMTTEEVVSALGETRFIHENNTFRTTTNLVTGQYDLARRSIRMVGEMSLADPESETNHLNRLLALTYYSACKVKYNGNPPAMLVHACGIIRNGRALLFAGPSEAGKTTIARFCSKKDGEVLNDEMLLVTWPCGNGGAVTVQGAPIISQMCPRRNNSAPLSCILLLKKGPQTSIRRVDGVEAYLRFIRQIVSPAYIGQREYKAIYNLMADFSKDVTQNIPVFELEFTLDADRLWKVIGDLEENLEGIENGK